MPGEQYDIIVVGAGAAGCVVAARLAQFGSGSVLLLEAGPDLRSSLPEKFRDGWRLSPDFDWGYASEPDIRGQASPLRRGKLVGGTSWLTRFALRGSPADYDEWAALGNEGWSFKDVLAYFIRLESDLDFGDESWHGNQGPMPVTRYAELPLTEIAEAGLEALHGVGFPEIDDHNRPGAVGAGRMPMSSRDGCRVTTADRYLPVEGDHPNLTVRGEDQVDRVILEGNRAVGVRLSNGSAIGAGRLVLSAGTYGSPAILMRSGIGPSQHLQSLGIDVQLDLPGVGSNLADHGGIDIDTGYRGPARTAPLLHLLATFHSSAVSTSEAPDAMLWLSDPRGTPPIFEIDVGLLRPRSRGTVRLRSADPADPPRIQLPALRQAVDVERLVEAYMRGLEVANRKEIRQLCSKRASPQAVRGGKLEDLIRTTSYSFPHVVGTCSMGPRPEDGAVVDVSGRVHGISGLSVVDASIIPNGLSAFTHFPVIMLAEKLAEQTAALD